MRARSASPSRSTYPGRLLVDRIMVAHQQLAGLHLHGRHLIGPVPVAGVPGSNGNPNRSTQPCEVQTCSAWATSATWSSWMRVRCQTSQAIELALGRRGRPAARA
jgi:hypothetical protein